VAVLLVQAVVQALAQVTVKLVAKVRAPLAQEVAQAVALVVVLIHVLLVRDRVVIAAIILVQALVLPVWGVMALAWVHVWDVVWVLIIEIYD